MIRYYRPTHFELEELIPPETLQALGRKAWLVLDPRALFTLDQLRDAFGMCTVNDWHEGGALKYRGFRPPECTVGAHYSQHRFGRAFDCTFRQTAEIVRQEILEHRDQFPYLTTLESDVSWLHFDCRDHGGEDIELVHP